MQSALNADTGSLPQLTQETRPLLASKARLQIDRVTHKPILLYPEGVVLLNETSEVILRLCDGEHTFDEIVNDIAQRYQEEPEILQKDVSKCLCALHKHSLIELH